MTLLGRILKPHGLKGEVRVLPIEFALQEKGVGSVLTLKRKHRELRLKIETIRRGPRYLIIKFEGINSLEEAEALRGFEILGEETKAPTLEGKKAMAGGRILGIVKEVLPIPMNPVVVIETDSGKEILVPKKFCMEKENVVEVNLPPGLEEI